MSRLLLFLSLVCLPQALAAQDPRLAGRLDATTLGAVSSIIDSARADGLPAEPLVQKALEGASKRAPGEAIVRAVRTLASNLRTVRITLGMKSSDQELLAGAAALRAGATPDALRELRRLGESRNLAVPLSVLADLVSQGIEVTQASRSVLDLARTDASDEDYLRLKQRFDGDRRP
jgi:hypothetical protein